MSPLTRWLALSAIAVIALLACNAIVYRRLHGRFVPQNGVGHSYLKQRVPRQDLGLMVLFVIALLVGVGAPHIAPQSSFAQWLTSPYASLVYYAWCLLGLVVAGALLGLYRLVASKPTALPQ